MNCSLSLSDHSFSIEVMRQNWHQVVKAGATAFSDNRQAFSSTWRFLVLVGKPICWFLLWMLTTFFQRAIAFLCNVWTLLLQAEHRHGVMAWLKEQLNAYLDYLAMQAYTDVHYAASPKEWAWETKLIVTLYWSAIVLLVAIALKAYRDQCDGPQPRQRQQQQRYQRSANAASTLRRRERSVANPNPQQATAVVAVAEDDLLEVRLKAAFQRLGEVLYALINTLIDASKFLDGKFRAWMEKDQVVTTRTFLEPPVRGHCFICFEARTNICTLCCGQSVHLNCLAQWLIDKNSCPHCRRHVPALSHRIRNRPAGGGGG